MYDFVIIGGGIAGSIMAFLLKNKNQKVAIVTKNNQNASICATAFISPMVGKPNRYKDFVLKSIYYSVKFYKKYFNDYMDNCGLLRVCKDLKEERYMQKVKPYFDFNYLLYDTDRLKKLNIVSNYSGYFFDIGSIVKSNIIYALQNKIDIFYQNVKYIDNKNSYFIINNIKAKHIILSSGADDLIIKEPYIGIRKVYGNKLEVDTQIKQTFNIHKRVSISKNIDGQIHIASTHHQKIEDIKNIKEKDTKQLLKDLQETVFIDDIKNIVTKGAFRACSVDYFPIVGNLIDSKKTINRFGSIVNGAKISSKNFIRYKNIFIINGLGSRGYSFAPYVCNMLVDHILEQKELDNLVSLDRLFIKWARRDYKNMDK